MWGSSEVDRRGDGGGRKHRVGASFGLQNPEPETHLAAGRGREASRGSHRRTGLKPGAVVSAQQSSITAYFMGAAGRRWRDRHSYPDRDRPPVRPRHRHSGGASIGEDGWQRLPQPLGQKIAAAARTVRYIRTYGARRWLPILANNAPKPAETGPPQARHERAVRDQLPNMLVVAPRITSPTAATRETVTPTGPTFSRNTNAVSPATQARFITPTANNTHMSAQQHPRQ
jgi:hypothetical protein